PTDKPSGKLWIAMAITNNHTPVTLALGIPSVPVTKCRCGNKRSTNPIHAAPSRIPTTAMAAGRGPGPYIAVEISIDGIINEKKEAARITPAAKPKRVSLKCSDGCLLTRIGSAPTAVKHPVIVLAINATRMASITPSLEISNLRHDRLCGSQKPHNIRLLHGFAK